MPIIRPERPGDQPAIHRVVAQAFGREGEARLVDALRASAGLTLSLVAEEEGVIVGHVAFSPVYACREGQVVGAGVGLAPLAVSPGAQRRGVGAALVTKGLASLAGLVPFVVVLGDPAYYARFGFERASACGLHWDGDPERAHDEAFRVVALEPGGLDGVRGVVSYAPELSAAEDAHGRPVDWTRLAREIGVGAERGGSDLARAALVRLVGDDVLIDAVRTYVAGGRGSELARSVLWMLRPPAAMAECERLHRSSVDLHERRRAIELLRVVADASVLAWLPGVLSDRDAETRRWAVGVLEQLAYDGAVSRAEVEPLLVEVERRAALEEDEGEREYLAQQLARIREALADGPA